MSDLKARFPHHHTGCICGRHRSQHEHDYDARLQQQPVLETREAARYDGVVAGAVMRTVFAKK
jgi:hypothetical protein